MGVCLGKSRVLDRKPVRPSPSLHPSPDPTRNPAPNPTRNPAFNPTPNPNPNPNPNPKQVAYLTCNGSPPVEGKPSLMTFSEATTLFYP